MNEFLSIAYMFFIWLVSHALATKVIVTMLLGFTAFCVGILLVRRDSQWRLLVFRRNSQGSYVHVMPCVSKAQNRRHSFVVGFRGFGLVPYLKYRDGKHWQVAELAEAEYDAPSAENDFRGWNLGWNTSGRDFEFDGDTLIIGIRPWNDARMPRTGRRIFGLLFWLMVIGIVVLTTLVNRNVALPVDSTTTPVVTTIAADPTATVEAPEPTAIPNEVDVEPITVTIYTGAPATNTDIWQTLGEYMPDIPMPETQIQLPSWFCDLFADTNMITVTPLRGLPGYALIMRSRADSVIVRLNENMEPVSYVRVRADYFTVSAHDFNWKVAWSDSSNVWYVPVEGKHGRFQIVINDDDTMTIIGRFSLYP